MEFKIEPLSKTLERDFIFDKDFDKVNVTMTLNSFNDVKKLYKLLNYSNSKELKYVGFSGWDPWQALEDVLLNYLMESLKK